MRANPIPLLTALFLLPLTLLAQNDLLLKSGALTPQQNITQENLTVLNRNLTRTAGKSLVIIQFNQLPREEEKKVLAANGIELLDYVPHNAYTASVNSSLDASILLQF